MLIASASGSLARNYSIPLGKGNVTVTIPSTWTVTDVDRGVWAKTPDEEVYVWVERFRDKQMDDIMGEHSAYLARQGVAVNGKPRTDTRVVNGLQMAMIDIPATWNGKRTVLQYLLVDPNLPSGWKIILTEWASPKGEKMYQTDLDTIMNKLSFTGR